MHIPADAIFIMETLEQAGYEAYLVGGCVRDTLIGRTPGDYDITTSAMPDEVEAVFAAKGIGFADYGKQHGTVVLLINGECYEVTTYRIDGEYTDNRRPDSVSFTRNIADDLARRDFTINAMAIDRRGEVVDLYGGQDDLAKRRIRAVGDPDVRFSEDALRVFRGVRFASQLGFEIEQNTADSIRRSKERLLNISAERLRVELMKTLEGKNAVPILREYRDVFATVIPEIAEMFDFEQHNPYHCYDVWEHTLHVIDELPCDGPLRLAGLFHDIGKPGCFVMKDGWGHFYGHEDVSAEMAERIMRRLKFDNQTISDVVTVVDAHSAVFNATEKYAKRKLNQLGEKRLKMLIALERADVQGQAYEVRAERVKNIDEFAKIVGTVLESKQCFRLSDLAVGGNEVMAAGVERGPRVGEVLNELLELVIAGSVPNEGDVLLAEIKRIIKRGNGDED